MELEVLEGAELLLKKFKPIILFETVMDFEVFRKSPIRKNTEDLLRSLNYEIFRLSPEKAPEKTTYPNFSDNSLAIPIEESESFLK